MAYGQTGSGKTHSMGGGWGAHSGTEDEVGVIPRVIKELFDGINSEKESFGFVVRVSYLEVSVRHCAVISCSLWWHQDLFLLFYYQNNNQTLALLVLMEAT